MTPTPSPDPGRCPECGCGWWEPHRTGCSEPRFLTPDPAAAGEGTERPGGWVDGIGWVARLGDVADDDLIRHGEPTSDPARDARRWYTPTVLVEVTRWADGSTPQPPVPPQGGERPDTDTLRKIGAGTDGDGITLLTRAERAFLARAADWIDAHPAPSSSPVGGRGLDVEQARPGTVPGSAADLNGHLASLIADGDLRVRVVLAVDAWLERCDARAAADREEPTDA